MTCISSMPAGNQIVPANPFSASLALVRCLERPDAAS